MEKQRIQDLPSHSAFQSTIMVHSDEQWYASYLELMLVLLYQQWRLRRLGSYRSPFTQAALACVVFSSALVTVNGILTKILPTLTLTLTLSP